MWWPAPRCPPAGSAEIIERLGVDDRDAFAVADIEELLIGRKREIARKNLVALQELFHELAVLVNIWTRRFSRSAT